MTHLFREINEKIRKFEKCEQAELIEHYVRRSIDKIVDHRPFGHKKLLLLLNITQYATNKETKMRLIHAGLGHKILAIRALILDLIDIDFSREQRVFYKPDKWIKIIIKDMRETFNYVDLLKKKQLYKTKNIDDIDFKAKETLGISSETEESSKHDNLDFTGCDNKNYEASHFQDIYSEDDLMLCLNLYNSRLCKEFLDIFCSCDKFNSSGNQLILNLVAYMDKMAFLDYDFGGFIRRIQTNFMNGKAEPLKQIVSNYKKYKTDKMVKKEPSKVE
ncbi:hypothetical protein ECANGB1_1663 [Enterospora canceri]|uniref:Uncharacterized protein n=1 Tax=Enterospora canceri TaxID=1081671 RepID=A0A1Y1S956_9MICR|nr:hypothetical protein ECANGB1_1663 [Enterospora canceri]